MKRAVSLLLAAAMLMGFGATCSAGLFPSTAELFRPMPSFAYAAEREPDKVTNRMDGSIEECYLGVTKKQVDIFSGYLEYCGCSLAEYAVNGTVFTARVEKNGGSFEFRYDEAEREAVLRYPSGSVPEDAGKAVAAAAAAAAAARRAEWTTVGNIVTFGAYEQDNDASNGKEAIEWIVLDAKDDGALIISRYGLDAKRYNEEYVDVTWETCTLRKWLNGEFLNDAFTDADQARIVTTEVTADKNPDYSTNPGKATKDKVFLLSIAEANRYFASDEARKCAPTAYAKAQGAWTNEDYKTADGELTGWWWLRSPGYVSRNAAIVHSDGSVFTRGNLVGNSHGVARPALWVKF